MTTLNGPLLGLSFRRVGRHCGKSYTPAPLDNEQRRRALQAVWPMARDNDFNWQQSAANQYAAEQCADAERSTDDYYGEF